jgi:hypothetical protein
MLLFISLAQRYEVLNQRRLTYEKRESKVRMARLSTSKKITPIDCDHKTLSKAELLESSEIFIQMSPLKKC